jgi:hypothetical protein
MFSRSDSSAMLVCALLLRNYIDIDKGEGVLNVKTTLGVGIAPKLERETVVFYTPGQFCHRSIK